MATLRNDFHNTKTNVRAGRISDATADRVRRALCGIKGCTCGSTPLHTRGPQEVEIVVKYDGLLDYCVVGPRG